MTSGEPSFIHVTVVAGEPVEVQVRWNESGSKVRLVMLGGTNNEKGYININVAYTLIAVQKNSNIIIKTESCASISVYTCS